MSKQIDTAATSAEDEIGSHQRLTPAVLGIPSVSYGTKLPPSMSSEDTSQLLMKLAEWRKKREDKLVANILAKRRLQCKSKSVTALPKYKPKSTNTRSHEDSKPTSDRQMQENKTVKLNTIKKRQNMKQSHPVCGLKVKRPQFIITHENDANVLESNSDDLPTQEVEIIIPSFENTCPELAEDIEHLESENKLNNFDSEEIEKIPESNTEEVGNNAEHLDETYEQTIEVHCDLATENEAQCKLQDLEPQEEENAKLFVKPKKLINDVFKRSNIANQKSPLRRSLSSVFPEKASNTKPLILRAHSENNVQALVGKKGEEKFYTSETKTKIDFVHDKVQVDNVDEKVNPKGRNVSFATPKNKMLTATQLRDELENWLSEHGHSIDNYKHLRCFGLTNEATLRTPCHRRQETDDLTNLSFYSTAPNTPMPDFIDDSDKENVTPTVPAVNMEEKNVEGWLGDLHHLIVHARYPNDRCEQWLSAVSRKFPNCTQLPIYWECFAALYGGDKDLKKTANGGLSEINGSENKEDDVCKTSLEELFDKMILSDKCTSPSRIDRGLDPKNIFRSKTVKFALQKKSIRRLDPTLGRETCEEVTIATPVRRSTRIQTPDRSNVVGSLKKLDPEMRRSVAFQPNEALLTG